MMRKEFILAAVAQGLSALENAWLELRTGRDAALGAAALNMGTGNCNAHWGSGIAQVEQFCLSLTLDLESAWSKRCGL